MESASSETEPDAQEAPNSTPNMTAFITNATQSALRYRGSTGGGAEQDVFEQQDADMGGAFDRVPAFEGL